MSIQHLYSKKPTKRQLIVADAVRESISKIFLNNSFHDELLDSVALTFPLAKISPDLKSISIFVSTFDMTNIRAILKRMNEKSPLIRKLVAKNIKLKYIPEIKFVQDDVTAKSINLEAMLNQLPSSGNNT